MTDTVMCDVKIKNANAVIHYDLPQKKSAFGKRLYYMMDNFPGVNGEVCTSQICCLHIIKKFVYYLK